MTWSLVTLGFLAGAGGSWLNSYLTELAVKFLFSSRNSPTWGAGLFGLFFMTKLTLLFAFCYAVIRFLHFSLWAVIAGILSHQAFHLIRLALRYRTRIKAGNQTLDERGV
ncbi:MAG: hypothetical protein DRI61_09895 [Chloroflexi bacterium]|nr:MAG: hypothetical protein DRI61_09895 [Chloroflexota bacterium]HDN80571.1 hypothetical protein [Chloroflexota bacterium]